MEKKITVYLVGGYIRDEMLNLFPKEKDWIIVNGSPSHLLKLNFINVGNSFPVFLHPNTKEEYALARTEKKIELGHKGFKCYNSDVSLTSDLKRRDLTINAIAKSFFGQYIDPHGGISDIKSKLIKNVSISFIEDPLRVLRAARFLSKLYHVGFKLHHNLFFLMKKVAHSTEIQQLSKDRILNELKKALLTKNPDIFFKLLFYLDILKQAMPTLYAIWKNNNNYRIIRKVFFNLYIYRQKNKNIGICQYILNEYFFKEKKKSDMLFFLSTKSQKNIGKFFSYFTYFYNISEVQFLNCFEVLNSLKMNKKKSSLLFALKVFSIRSDGKKNNNLLNIFLIKNYKIVRENKILDLKLSAKRNTTFKIFRLQINNIFYIRLFFDFNYFK